MIGLGLANNNSFNQGVGLGFFVSQKFAVLKGFFEGFDRSRFKDFVHAPAAADLSMLAHGGPVAIPIEGQVLFGCDLLKHFRWHTIGLIEAGCFLAVNHHTSGGLHVMEYASDSVQA